MREAVELASRGNPNLRGDAFTADTLAAAAARAAAHAADAVAVLSGS